MKTKTMIVLIVALSASAIPTASADEGMWLLTNPPRQQLQSRYGFTFSQQWLEHMQKSAVRFTGASGSLISPSGLVLTNHHVGRSAIGKLSSAEHDFIKNGFYAKSLDDELKCTDLTLDTLWSIKDVTKRIKSAATGDMTLSQANTARRQMMSAIEQESQDETGLLSQVVTLYNGGQYHLYSYKRYTDVRLVFAPEQQIAAFGGDIDNFEYPRYCADFSIFRIYEDGKPLKNEHYLRWSDTGAAENELAFIFGHPGRTSRLETVAQLEFTRDTSMPFDMAWLFRREVELQAFMGRSAEYNRIGQTRIKGVANGRKARVGMMGGLLDPELMRRKRDDEQRLRASFEGTSSADNPWDRVARAMQAYTSFYRQQAAINGVFRGGLTGYAMTLVRMAQELPKPSSERLREYRDTALPRIHQRLNSTAPIYDALEVDSLTSALIGLAWTYGADHPVVQTALGGRSPRARAEQLILGSSLKDVQVRRTLADGGWAAIEASDDPLIMLARSLESHTRELRTRYEDEVQAVQRQAYAQIAAARFALDGDSVYPDATGTLRLSYGPIADWEEMGKKIPSFTNIGGLYERAELRKGEQEFILPESWIKARSRLDPATPMNFICKGDVIGGNSGSPIVNAKGEVIGLVFDGNIHMLVGRYAYDERTNRTIAVDARLIKSALKNVYGTTRIINEINDASKTP